MVGMTEKDTFLDLQKGTDVQSQRAGEQYFPALGERATSVFRHIKIYKERASRGYSLVKGFEHFLENRGERFLKSLINLELAEFVQ